MKSTQLPFPALLKHYLRGRSSYIISEESPICRMPLLLDCHRELFQIVCLRIKPAFAKYACKLAGQCSLVIFSGEKGNRFTRASTTT